MAFCPLLKKECIKDKCEWWNKTTMKNTQTQQLYIEEKCAVNVIAPMLVEVIKNTASTQAAVESSRNETVKRQDEFLNIIAPIKALK